MLILLMTSTLYIYFFLKHFSPCVCVFYLFIFLPPVAKLYLTPGDLKDCMDATGFPILHYLPEFAKIQVHWVTDAI